MRRGVRASRASVTDADTAEIDVAEVVAGAAALGLRAGTASEAIKPDLLSQVP